MFNTNMAEYTWLREYKRTWETEQPSGYVAEETTKKTSYTLRPVLKQTVLILDYSKFLLNIEIGTLKQKLLSDSIGRFCDLYFTHNPISSLQLIMSRNGRAYVVTREELTGSPSGEFSLKNSIELALHILNAKETYWSKEILIIHNTLGTGDPGNVWDTLYKAQNAHCRISVFSLSAQVFVFQQSALLTNGLFTVIRDVKSLHENLEYFAQCGMPSNTNSLIPMAFPSKESTFFPCACHLTPIQGYTCPVCLCAVCKIPSECKICKTLLVSTPHISKAKLSLMPLRQFTRAKGACSVCLALEGSLACPSCCAVYCRVCEEFLRIYLGKCISCEI